MADTDVELLAGSEIGFSDATFKVAPKSYYQLLVVQVKVSISPLISQLAKNKNRKQHQVINSKKFLQQYTYYRWR